MHKKIASQKYSKVKKSYELCPASSLLLNNEAMKLSLSSISNDLQKRNTTKCNRRKRIDIY